MPQLYKTIYFPDHPGDSARKKNVKLAFGKADEQLYRHIKPLTGQELREIIGFSSYESLRMNAEREDLPLNTFCLRRLRQIAPSDAPIGGQRSLPGFDDDLTLPIDPVLATFRGGKAEPMHNWYPYLEGYSPEFVMRILREFSPKAQHILDPFCGTGATPLAVARMARRASYCEINPLLQFLVLAKSSALSVPSDLRERIARYLEDFGDELPGLLRDRERDIGLA